MLRFCSQEEPGGLLQPPSPQHIRLQLCGNMPGLGAAARTLLALLKEASCCSPKIFPKSPHRISQLLPILHFLFGEIPGSLEPEKLKFLPVPFSLNVGSSSSCSPLLLTVVNMPASQNQNNLEKDNPHQVAPPPIFLVSPQDESCLFGELLKPVLFSPEITFLWEGRPLTLKTLIGLPFSHGSRTRKT